MYATIEDVAAGYWTLAAEEAGKCQSLIDEAEVMVDAVAPGADGAAKKVAVCRMVRRALAALEIGSVPLGATQGSQTAGPYSQSWTMGGGSVGQVYLDRSDKLILGMGNRIGSRSPLEGTT